ncbi:MAG: hypothetical protein JNM22_06405 [Saprospiraceae bacterium]|nr:hypothetical protein [Saprospiraceae bacterium]
MSQSSPVQFQVIRLLFIDSDNMLNQHVIAAFLNSYGIKARVKERQNSTYSSQSNEETRDWIWVNEEHLSHYSSHICVTTIDLPEHQIKLESFDFTYKFHQLSHARQIDEITHLITHYNIHYIFSDFCLNKLTVHNEKGQNSQDARVFYYSTHPDEVVNMFGKSKGPVNNSISDPTYMERKLFLTGAGGVLSKLDQEQVKALKGIVLYGYMSHKLTYDLDRMRTAFLQQLAHFTGTTPDQVQTEVVFLDTSTFFSKANDTEFSLEKNNRRVKASARIRREYSQIVGHVLFQWFEALRRKTYSTTHAEDITHGVEAFSNPDDYFNLNNLDISAYLKTLNSLNILSETQNNKEVAWNIGATSFFVTGQNYRKEYYLVDVPFRDYGDELEKYIAANKISKFSYENFDLKNRIPVQNRYMYYEYWYDYTKLEINLVSAPQSNLNENSKTSKEETEKLLHLFLPLAHTVVFYEPEAVGKALNKCTLKITNADEMPQNGELIQLFCFINRLKDVNSDGMLITYVSRKVGRLSQQYESEEGARKFYNYLFPLLESKIRNLLSRLQERTVIKLARQAAISRILSRNFSHHMGSHIHPRTKTALLADRLSEISPSLKTETTARNAFINWLRDHHNEYVVWRNEFMADPFTPPKTMYFYRELVLPMAENMLLMDNLAASEGIRYDSNASNRLYFRFFFQGHELMAEYGHSSNKVISDLLPPEFDMVRYPFQFPYYVDISQMEQQISHEEFYANKSIIPDKDPQVSIPNEHAFFSLMENLIRNIAKHQKNQLNPLGGDPKSLEICIRVTDNTTDDSCYTVDVYDNVSELENYQQWKAFKERVKADFVNPKDDFRPSNQNLGILDMKICASIMAGYKDIASEDTAIYNNNTLQVYLRVGDQLFQDDFLKETFQYSYRETAATESAFIWEKNQPLPEHTTDPEPANTFDFAKARINYRFKIQKARKIAYIGRDIDERDYENRAFLQEGVYLFKNIHDFRMKARLSANSYGFVIIQESMLDGISEEELDKLFLKLPARTLLKINPARSENAPLQNPYFRNRLQETSLDIKPELGQTNQLLETCWKEWLGRYGDLRKASLMLHRENFSQKWKNELAEFQQNNPPFEVILDQGRDDNAFSQVNLKEGHMYAIYDHHSKGIKKIKNGLPQVRNENYGYVTYDKNSLDFSWLDTPPFAADDEKWLFPYKLFNAAMLRVLIIDERFAEYAKRTSSEIEIASLFPYQTGKESVDLSIPMKNFDLCWASNVFIATHVNFSGEQNALPLNGSIQYGKYDHTLTLTFDGNQIGSFTNFFRDEPSNNRKLNFDFVIIHRTMFSNNQWLKGTDPKQFIKALRRHIPHVILESGGNNHLIDHEFCKFISYNELSSYFNDKTVSKYRLAQRLISLIT